MAKVQYVKICDSVHSRKKSRRSWISVILSWAARYLRRLWVRGSSGSRRCTDRRKCLAGWRSASARRYIHDCPAGTHQHLKHIPHKHHHQHLDLWPLTPTQPARRPAVTQFTVTRSSHQRKLLLYSTATAKMIILSVPWTWHVDAFP